MGRYDEWPNVFDFIEYKLRHEMEDAAARGREDVAEAIWTALSAYLLGEIDLVFLGGIPHMKPGPNHATTEPTVDVLDIADVPEVPESDSGDEPTHDPFDPPGY